MTEDKDEKSRVPALNRALAVLDLLQAGPMSITEIIAHTGMARSTAYILIDEMINQNLVRQNDNGTVQLWMRLIQFGTAAREGLNVRDAVAGSLRKLMEQINCLAVHFGIMEGYRAYYVAKLVPLAAPLGIRTREGMPVDLVHTALGKCLLAYQEKGKRNSILSALDYTPATARSIACSEDLRVELDNIVKRGWAMNDSEVEPEIRSVAVPVFGIQNIFLGALSAVGTVSNFTDEYVQEVIKKVKETAGEIEIVCSSRTEQKAGRPRAD